MKKILAFMFLFWLFISPLYSQKYQIGILGGTYWDKGLESFLEVRNRYTSTRSFYKSQFGVEVKREIFNKFSLVTGYNFTYSYLHVSLVAGQPPALYTGTKLFTHSIPLLLDYRLDFPKLPGKSISFRAGGGIEFFMPQYTEFGSWSIENIYTSQFKYALFYTLYTPKNPIPFLQANIGFEDKLGENNKIRVGLGYKFLLANFGHEIYNYYYNYSSPEVISIVTNETKISYFLLDICYSFNLKNPHWFHGSKTRKAPSSAIL